LFDFIKIKISFRKEINMIELKVIVKKAHLQFIPASKVKKSLKEAICGLVWQLVSLEAEEELKHKKMNDKTIALLGEFTLVFYGPK